MPRQGERSISRLGLAEQVFETIERRILDLEYQAGEKLVIDQIARELDVSSTPVRDALNRLTAERLVVFTSYLGFTVRAAPGLDEVRQSFDARYCIEVAASMRATENAKADDIERLRHIADEIAAGEYTGSADGFIRFTRANREFHKTIVELGGNRFLTEAWENLNHDELVAFTLHDRGIPDLAQITREHALIIAALESGDAAAMEQAAGAHIVDGSQRILDSLQAEQRNQSAAGREP